MRPFWFLLLATAAVQATNYFPTEEARNQYIRDTYGSGIAASNAHQTPARFGFENDLDNVIRDKDSSTTTSYIEGVALWPLVALTLGFVCLLVGYILPCCRSCKCCACCKPKDSGAIKLLLAVLALILALKLAGASVGLVYNAKVTDVQRDVRSAGHSLMADTRAKITEMTDDVNNLNSVLDIVFPAMRTIVNQTSATVNAGVTGMQTQLYNQGTYMLNATVRGYFCSACQLAGYAFRNYSLDMSTTTTTALQTILSNIVSTLVDAEPTIDQATTEVLQRMSEAYNKTQDFDSNIDHYGHDYVGYYDSMRNATTAGIYSISFLTAVLAGLGLLVLFWSTRCKRVGGNMASCASYTAILACFIMLLMLAVHVALSLFLGDACWMIDKREVDISSVFPDDSVDLTAPNRTVANAIKTCLCDENFISTFGYDDDLEFRSKITFPAAANVSINLTNELAQIAAVQAFTVANFGTVSPVDQTAVAWYLSNLTANVTTLRTYLLYQQSNISLAQQRIMDAQATLEPAFDQVDLIEEDATCGFLGTFYGRVKTQVCSDGVYDIGMMCLAFFLVFATMITSAFIILRLRDHWYLQEGGYQSLETTPF